METHSDLVSGREVAKLEDAFIAVVRDERDQEQQRACNQCGHSLTIDQPGRHRLLNIHQPSDGTPITPSCTECWSHASVISLDLHGFYGMASMRRKETNR